MKKSYIIIGSIALLVLILFFAYRGTYNTAISLQESVDKSWGDVQSTYQRRLDLIPNLMKTVKAAAKNEKDILWSSIPEGKSIIDRFWFNNIDNDVVFCDKDKQGINLNEILWNQKE